MLLVVSILYLLTALTKGSRLAIHPRSIIRQHYGTTFVGINTFTPTTGHWLHTFVATLPSQPVIRNNHDLDCTSAAQSHEAVNTTHCERVKPYIEALSALQEHMTNLTLDVIISLQRIIPEGRPPTQRARQTRSWLPFLGSILKTVTGTSTTDDLNKLSKTVQQIRCTQIRAYDQWSQTESELASAMHLANKRMIAIQNLVNLQRQSMSEQYREFSDNLNILFEETELIPESLKRTVDFACVLVHITELRLALEDAMNGRLTTYLVRHHQMAKTMHEITQQLSSIHPAFTLAYRSVAEAYQSSDFMINRMGRDIFITVKFPVTTDNHIYTLYKVALFPVIVSNDEEHVTVLDTSTIAFAYSRLSRYYIEFSEMPTVVNHMLDMSTHMEPFRYINRPTCLWALFTSTTRLITKLCTFHLLPNSVKPSIKILDNSIILFTKVRNITRVCVDRENVQLEPCTQCVHRLACRCSFDTEIGYVAPSLEFCGPILSKPRPATHVTNLAILSYFFDQTALGALATDTMLRHPIETSLPKVDIYNDENYSAQLAVIDKTKLDLDKTVNLSIQRKTAYRSMAELLEHKRELDTDATSVLSVIEVPQSYRSTLLIVCTVLSVVAMAFCVVLSVKIRALSIVLMATTKAHAVTLPRYLNFYTTPMTAYTIIPPTSQQGFDDSTRDILNTFATVCIAAILVILILCVGTMYFQVRFWTKPRTIIYLQLGTSDTYIYVKLLSLPHDLSFYSFVGRESIQKMKVTGCLFPRLHFEWPDLKMRHIKWDKIIPPPTNIALTRAQAKTMRSILDQETEKILPILYAYNLCTFVHSIITFILPKVEPIAPPQDTPEPVEYRHIYPIV